MENNIKKDRKKVGIITYSDSMNWGAQLQAYALVKTVEDYGMEAHQIDHRPMNTNLYRRGKSPSTIAGNLVAFFTKKEFQERVRRTEKFRDQYLHMTEQCHTEEKMKELNDKFDCFISGSDQVWNCTRGINSNFYLDFVADADKKCAYAASFGISKLPDQYRYEAGEKLQTFRYISVRENAGCQIISDMCGMDVDCVCDPVFLLKAEEWKRVALSSSEAKAEKAGKYIFVYSTQITKEFVNLVSRVKKEYNLPAISLTWIPGCKVVKDPGPAEFVDYILHAEAVVTTSFHATVFSTIFHRKFFVLPHKTTGNRVINILEKLGLQGQIVEEHATAKVCEPDFELSDKKLQEYREASLHVLENILSGKTNTKVTEKNIRRVKDICTGCRVCENVCPKKCIEMKLDEDGFLYPMVDQDKCISCGVCLKKCHVYQRTAETNTDKGKYGYAKDEQLRREGSSGGAFSAIVETYADKYREIKIYGSLYDKNDGSVHQTGVDYPDYKSLCQSKYVFSDPRNTFSEVKEDLETGKRVIYCGTPCQIGALQKYLNGCYPNLLTLDFICHGVPAEQFMKQHISYISKSQKVFAEFRSKAMGWGLHKYCMKLTNEEGNTVYLKKAGKDLFFTHFLKNDCLRLGCYRCQYSGKHDSDITLGDFWEVTRWDPTFDDGKGISVVFANTEKGMNCVQILEEKMLLKELPAEYHRSHCGVHTRQLPARSRFLHQLRTMSFEKIERQFSFGRPVILVRKLIKKISGR